MQMEYVTTAQACSAVCGSLEDSRRGQGDIITGHHFTSQGDTSSAKTLSRGYVF